MSPEQFLQRLRKGPPAPVYLFLGPELYQLGLCRRALIEKALAAEDLENGLVRHDLESTTMAEVLDDARSLSLFAMNRVIWVSGAETALPKGRASASQDENSGGAQLAEYARNPTPGTVVVFESSRFEFDGDDRAKIERVQKFYAAIPDVVEFRPYTLESARQLAQDLVKAAGLQIGISELGLLVDSLAADASRLANEIEKLRLYVGTAQESHSRRHSAAGSQCPSVHDFRVGCSTGARRSQTLSRQPGYIASRRRILAAGADVSGYAIPAGHGCAGSRTENIAADPRVLFKAGNSHVARSRKSG